MNDINKAKIKHRHFLFWMSLGSLCIIFLAFFFTGCDRERQESKLESTTKMEKHLDRDKDENSQTVIVSGESTEQEEAEVTGGTAYNFDQDEVGKIAKGWSYDRTGGGTMGNWVVMKDETATSKPNVFAQISQDETDYRFPVAVIDTSSYKDVELSVKYKPVKGKVDQGGGLVWRYKDINNHYVVRANALENNVNFYKVIDGRRKFVKGANVKVASGQWHTLKVEAKGNAVDCYFDGEKVLQANDNTFTNAGKVGLWTKADSYILFDDFKVK